MNSSKEPNEGYVSHDDLEKILKDRKIDSYDRAVTAAKWIVGAGMGFIVLILGYFSITSLNEIRDARDEIVTIRDNIDTRIQLSVRRALEEVTASVDNKTQSLDREQALLRTYLLESSSVLRDDMKGRMTRIEEDYREFTGRPLTRPELVLIHDGDEVIDGGEYVVRNQADGDFDVRSFRVRNDGDGIASLSGITFYFEERYLNSYESSTLFTQEIDVDGFKYSWVQSIDTYDGRLTPNAWMKLGNYDWRSGDGNPLSDRIRIRVEVYYNGPTLKRTFYLTNE